MPQPIMVYWTSNTGKARTGELITHLRSRHKVLVRLQSGQVVEIPPAKLLENPVNRDALKGNGSA